MNHDRRSRYVRLCSRTVVGFGAASLVLLAALILLPTPALALLPFDPASVVGGEYQQWTSTAQGFARSIYLALLVFELIAVAITTLLFRENLAEFFATVGFKVFMGGLFFWFIANGPNLAQTVIGWFSSIGQNQFGGPGGTAGPYLLLDGVTAVAGAFFAAADIAHAADQVILTALSTPPFCVWVGFGDGVCPVAPIVSALNSHATFIMIAQGVGFIILMTAAAIILQFSIVTIESFLVMSVGVLFIGFAGSRWTFSFSAGYFSYMINVGVKLMVTYIMLGVATNELLPLLILAGGTVTAASGIPFGYGTGTAIGLAAMAAVYLVLTAGLLWTIPAFAAALLTGQSQSSGFAILQQAAGSFAGAASMFANFKQASATQRKDVEDAAASQRSSHTDDSNRTGATSGRSPVDAQQWPAAERNSTQDHFVDPSGKQQLPPSPDIYRASALSGLAQAAPREIGQPSAVQVRLSNPDKL